MAIDVVNPRFGSNQSWTNQRSPSPLSSLKLTPKQTVRSKYFAPSPNPVKTMDLTILSGLLFIHIATSLGNRLPYCRINSRLQIQSAA